MKRGFVTIATGKEQYYKVAANLVKSYRFFSKNPLPFAIIAEEENEYTALFDDVVITNESKHSFMDKFLLLKLCPYDENIFLDADQLAFGDLNVYFDMFEGATDFSAIGVDVDKYAQEGAWYNVEDIWKYGDLIEYKSRVHAGIMFIRNSDKLKKLYDDCCDIYSNYDKLKFHTCPQSYDEATLGIAMPMNGMKTVKEKKELMCFYPISYKVHANPLTQKLSFSTDWGGHIDKGLHVHYGTNQTYKPLYKFNIECFELLYNLNGRKLTFKEKLLYKYELSYWIKEIPYSVDRFFKRVINKLLRQHKDI